MILVIPDVHGRSFWREPCADINSYSRVVFLGDYLDPYGFDDITLPEAFANFCDIVAFAEAHRGKVTLLLGNHDLHYITTAAGRSTRHSPWMAEKAAPVFEEDKHLCHLACQVGAALITHAGCQQGWIDGVNLRFPEVQLKMEADSLNGLLDSEEYMRALGMVGERRGGYYKYGSCVWADIDEHLTTPSPIPQVFGHTLQRCGFEIARPDMHILMLDCAHAFELDAQTPFNYTRLNNPQIDKI